MYWIELRAVQLGISQQAPVRATGLDYLIVLLESTAQQWPLPAFPACCSTALLITSLNCAWEGFDNSHGLCLGWQVARALLLPCTGWIQPAGQTLMCINCLQSCSRLVAEG